MIQLNGAFLEKRVNSNLIGMRTKESVVFAYTLVICIHQLELFHFIELGIT